MPLDPEFTRVLAEQLARFTSEEIGPIEESRAITELGLDSLSLMEIVTGLEDHFNVDLDGHAISQLQTVGDLARFVTAGRTSG